MRVTRRKLPPDVSSTNRVRIDLAAPTFHTISLQSSHKADMHTKSHLARLQMAINLKLGAEVKNRLPEWLISEPNLKTKTHSAQTLV